MKHRPLLLVLLLAVLSPPSAHGQASSFTYQGQLRQSGQPFTGTANLEFRLYNQLISGAQIGGIQTATNWPVEDGLFRVEIDFGAAAFDGSDRYLEVRVDETPLTPRQKITATPYALLAAGLASGSVNGASVDPAEVQLRISSACPSGQYIRAVNQDGSVLCGFDDSGTPGWTLAGNGGLSNNAFIGTLDDTPVNIRVDGKRAMRYEWGFSSSGAPNIIGGVDANMLPDNYEASIIAGGGLAGAPNSILGNASVIGGGIGNNIDGNWSVIPGGRGNTVNASDSVAMGQGATANHNNVFIWNDGGSFASTGPDQFLIDAGGGVGIGTNNPSDQFHISIPAGDAMRVQIGGQTRFRIHDNGGISIGLNSGPPANGLLVNGDIRYSQPRTRWLTLGTGSFVPTSSIAAYSVFRRWEGLRISPVQFCSGPQQNLAAPVNLPHGAVVRELRLVVTDQDSDGDFALRLRRSRTNGDDLEVLANLVTSGSSDSPRQFTDNTINFAQIDNENFVYSAFITVGCDDGVFTIHSVRIEYELRDVL